MEVRLLAVVALAQALKRIALTPARRRLPSMFPMPRGAGGGGEDAGADDEGGGPGGVEGVRG